MDIQTRFPIGTKVWFHTDNTSGNGTIVNYHRGSSGTLYAEINSGGTIKESDIIGPYTGIHTSASADKPALSRPSDLSQHLADFYKWLCPHHSKEHIEQTVTEFLKSIT